MISLDFLKRFCAKMSAAFPHLNQRGNRGGSSFSPFVFLIALSVGANAEQHSIQGMGQNAEQKIEQSVEQQIDQAIHQYIQTMMNQHAKENGWQGMRLAITNTPLTRTQLLAPCPAAITVSGGSATKLARQQLILECKGNTSKGSTLKGSTLKASAIKDSTAANWQIKVSSELQVFLPVVMSKTVINRGDTIQRNQLQLQENEITRSPRGFYHRLDQVTNMGAKRRIRANQILSPDLIDQPQLIKRGEKIKIIANRDGISASMPGEALEKGSEGEVIRVKNLSSGKTIEAKVVGAGVVSSTF